MLGFFFPSVMTKTCKSEITPDIHPQDSQDHWGGVRLWIAQGALVWREPRIFIASFDLTSNSCGGSLFARRPGLLRHEEAL